MVIRTATKDRIIDFDITLTAVADKVHFGDTKEGTFAVRLATELEEPHMRAKGIARTGKIRNAEGKTTEANTWGKQSPWVDYVCDWTLAWSLPTERENPDARSSTPLNPNDIRTLRIYASHTANSDAQIEFVMDVDPFLLQWIFAGLAERRWWYTTTVIDTNGRESVMIAGGINHISNTECIPN